MKVKDQVMLDGPVCQLALADDSGINSNAAKNGLKHLQVLYVRD